MALFSKPHEAYLRQVRTDEEQALCQRITQLLRAVRSGMMTEEEQQLPCQLIAHYEKTLLGPLASRLAGTVDKTELIHEGKVGLLTALRNFNPSKGVPFRWWARRLVLEAMLALVCREEYIPRQERVSYRDDQRVRNAQASLSQERLAQVSAAAVPAPSASPSTKWSAPCGLGMGAGCRYGKRTGQRVCPYETLPQSRGVGEPSTGGRLVGKARCRAGPEALRSDTLAMWVVVFLLKEQEDYPWHRLMLVLKAADPDTTELASQWPSLWTEYALPDALHVSDSWRDVWSLFQQGDPILTEHALKKWYARKREQLQWCMIP